MVDVSNEIEFLNLNELSKNKNTEFDDLIENK